MKGLKLSVIKESTKLFALTADAETAERDLF
jgi:hypothetical protein